MERDSRNDYGEMQATVWTEIEAERAAETDLRDKDAKRQCIISGIEPALCQLDPYDPYGKHPQNRPEPRCLPSPCYPCSAG